MELFSKWSRDNTKSEYFSLETTNTQMDNLAKETLVVTQNMIADMNLMLSRKMQPEVFLNKTTSEFSSIMRKYIEILQKEYPQCKTIAGI